MTCGGLLANSLGLLRLCTLPQTFRKLQNNMQLRKQKDRGGNKSRVGYSNNKLYILCLYCYCVIKNIIMLCALFIILPQYLWPVVNVSETRISVWVTSTKDKVKSVCLSVLRHKTGCNTRLVADIYVMMNIQMNRKIYLHFTYWKCFSNYIRTLSYLLLMQLCLTIIQTSWEIIMFT